LRRSTRALAVRFDEPQGNAKRDRRLPALGGLELGTDASFRLADGLVQACERRVALCGSGLGASFRIAPLEEPRLGNGGDLRGALLGDSHALLCKTDALIGKSHALLGDNGALLGDSHVLLGDSHVLLGDSHVLLGSGDALLGKNHAFLGKSHALLDGGDALLGKNHALV
jgi:hypothetical protein